jgi:dTDP-4-dehydrorhamnose reductase
LKILLTGPEGQVGAELAKVLPSTAEVIAVRHAELDLGDSDAIRRFVREVRPELIINAAAYTAVDKAEQESDLAMRVNGTAPGVLAEEAKRLGAILVHYSTDYVFDGAKQSAYKEEDAPNPLNVYGRTKLAGDRAISESGCRYLILRTSWVYGARGKNFFLTIASKARAGERLRVVADQRGVPTTSGFLADKTVLLLRKGAMGLLHLVPDGETTWYDFACEIVRLTGANTSVEPIRTADFASAARRPANSVLDNRKAVAILGEPMPDWRTLLHGVSAVASES